MNLVFKESAKISSFLSVDGLFFLADASILLYVREQELKGRSAISCNFVHLKVPNYDLQVYAYVLV